MQIIRVFLLLLICVTVASSQSYEVKLEPLKIDSLGGLQSYAIGTYDGMWLLVGGRLDGLHRRQPFAAFSEDGKNQELIVVDIDNNKVWRAPLSRLPTTMAEQLSSTNMQFYQDGDLLLCTGGYGYSPTAQDHITFPYLIVIDVPATIEKVKLGSIDSTTMKQFENETFRVTGGALNKLDSVYYLVGGHNFMGRYNPMGPEGGPGFFQEYTDEIRRFRITEEGNSVDVLEVSHDALHLHRRDYNLVPYISDGERNLMLYSGVFKNTVDLPWLYPVSITKEGYEPIEDFTQYYNHYHCAHLPVYDEETEEMHTIFFGGISQFYEEDGTFVQDNDVPFVNTIADVIIDKERNLREIKMNTEMPGLLGSGSILIPDPNLAQYVGGIIDGSELTTEYQHVGHIYGGIRSSLPNVFWINTGVESEASRTIFSVSIRKITDPSTAITVDEREFLTFYPIPADRQIRMSIDIDAPSDLSVAIYDEEGNNIYNHLIKKDDITYGRNMILLDDVSIDFGAYYYSVVIGEKTITRKVLWAE